MLFFFVVFNFFRALQRRHSRVFSATGSRLPVLTRTGGKRTLQRPKTGITSMQKQGTLMAFWGQPKKRAPDVDPEAPTPAKRTALTPAPAAASVGSPLLQAHCASRQ